MKIWLKKLSVTLIAIMTLGIYVPSTTLNAEPEENKDSVASKEAVTNDVVISSPEIIEEKNDNQTYNDSDYFIGVLTEQATEQVVTKLGPRISEKVADEFTEMILPNLEEVLKTILTDMGEDVIPYYGITEQPSRGLGEKIFHVYNYQTNQDIARFHVRRDNRPLEGYWFNFHYHLSKDNFEEHHEIGEIYWDKNIPPQWMS